MSTRHAKREKTYSQCLAALEKKAAALRADLDELMPWSKSDKEQDRMCDASGVVGVLLREIQWLREEAKKP